MKNQLLTLITAICAVTTLHAQEQTDSTSKELGEVVIKAFEQNKKLLDVPAAVSSISQKQLLRFNNTSIVSAMNIMPGVRMEERSPGSYRLNIRGSSLRSPFGVRNVKVYLNDIPFTEPGGSTYLNLLSFFNIQSIEVLKGPSGSLYGAGSGGAVLLRSHQNNQPSGIGIDYSFGSFGLQNTNVYARIGENKSQQTIGFNKLHSDGYRSWTKLDRSVFTWDGKFAINDKQSIRTFLMYADLAYQTPGGLTPAEFAANPKQSRPRVGTTPSSEQANAGVNQKSFLAGVSHDFAITETFKNTTSLYGAFSRFANPTVRNFERRSEPHAGGRTVFSFSPKIKTGTLKIVAGAELQKGWYDIRQYKNKNGVSDSLQTEDEVNTSIWSMFAQADWNLQNGWNISAGASTNQNTIGITRLTQFPLKEQKRTYANEIAPRIAILKKVTKEISVYASVAKGFSPPTSAEVLPSTGVISTNLNAEEGWNYELGTRMNLLNEKLFIDVNGFLFNLKNTIVQRRDGTGADFFINAGSAKQRGVEALVNYKLAGNNNKLITQSNIWMSYTYNNFTYKDFKQVNSDFSGKRLPGVPLSTVALGFDLLMKQGIYVNLTYNYNETVPLNDANTFKATDFHLLSARIGYRHLFFKKIKGEVFIGGDNLFNETYSLGNDINAAANRFFNVAAGRNYTAGLSLFFNCKNQ
ncbi:MAG: TonB-dependent receptor [Chitinophagaceae bacterium]|nr:TonB-dependent receptor [Chitinophagaceae bacterium]